MAQSKTIVATGALGLIGHNGMADAVDLKYRTASDPYTFGYQVTIRGHIAEGQSLTEYFLRYHRV